MSTAPAKLTAIERLRQFPDADLYYFKQSVLFAKEFAFGCVLDAGCGEGLVAQRIHYSPLVNRIILLDKDREQLKAASQLLSDDNYSVYITLRHDLTFELKHITADTILCFRVLEELAEHDVSLVFMNFKKILNPNGRLLMQVPINEIGSGNYEQWLSDVGLTVHEERAVPVHRTSTTPYQYLWLVGHTQLAETFESKVEKIRYFTVPTVVPV